MSCAANTARKTQRLPAAAGLYLQTLLRGRVLGYPRVAPRGLVQREQTAEVHRTTDSVEDCASVDWSCQAGTPARGRVRHLNIHLVTASLNRKPDGPDGSCFTRARTLRWDSVLRACNILPSLPPTTSGARWRCAPQVVAWFVQRQFVPIGGQRSFGSVKMRRVSHPEAPPQTERTCAE